MTDDIAAKLRAISTKMEDEPIRDGAAAEIARLREALAETERERRLLDETCRYITAEKLRLREALRYVEEQTAHLHGLAHVTGRARAALSRAVEEANDRSG